MHSASHPVTLSHALPDDARRRLAAMQPGGVHVLAFAPSGGWVMVGQPTAAEPGYAARGIPDACFVKLGEFVRAGHTIRSIAFPPSHRDAWVIVSDQAYFASGLPDDAFDALVGTWAQGARPSCLAFAPTGDGWALLAGATVHSRNLPADCAQALANHAQRRRPAAQLAFVRDGGWVLCSANGFQAEGIDEACRHHLAQVAQAHQIEHVAFTPSGGWAVGSNRVRTPLPADPLCTFEQQFRLVNGRWRALAERLAVLGAAGAQVTLRLDGQPAWSTGYGTPASDDTPLYRIDREPVPGRIGFTVSAHGLGAAALAEEIGEALQRVYVTAAEPVTR